MTGVAHQNPQAVYSGMKKYLQQDWDVMNGITPEVRKQFDPVYESLQRDLIPGDVKGIRGSHAGTGSHKTSFEKIRPGNSGPDYLHPKELDHIQCDHQKTGGRYKGWKEFQY